MYETLVQYKIPVVVLSVVIFVLLSLMAILSARLLQGSRKKVLTGPLYSTYLYIGATGIILGIGSWLIYRADKISMAVGICLVVFSYLVIFGTFVLAFSAKTYKKPVPTTKPNGFFKVI